MLFSIFSVFDSAGFWISHLLSVLFNKLSLYRFSSSWCSDACLHLWTDGNIPAFIAELLWAELHWWCACCGRSLADYVIIVGGASRNMNFCVEKQIKEPLSVVSLWIITLLYYITVANRNSWTLALSLYPRRWKKQTTANDSFPCSSNGRAWC